MLWNLPPIEQTNHSTDFDIVVVGGSISGLLCAHLLAKSDLKVALIEASTHPGAGDSALCMLPCALGLTDNIWRLVQSLGKEKIAELLNIQNEGIRWLKNNQLLNPKGCYHVALSAQEEHELFESANLLKEFGFDAHICSAQTCSEQLDAEFEFGGYHRLDEGYLTPASVFTTLLSQMSQVELFPRTKLLDIQSGNSGFALNTNRTQLKAEMIVVCAGLGSRHLDSFFTERLSSVRAQYTAFEVPLDLKDTFVEAQFGYQQWFKNKNQLVFSGCRWATPHLEMGEEEHKLSPAVSQAQERIVRKRYPTSGAVQKQWAALQTHTCDGLPFIGSLSGRDNLMTICGFQGKQATLGLGAALVFCEALTGKSEIPYWLQARRF